MIFSCESHGFFGLGTQIRWISGGNGTGSNYLAMVVWRRRRRATKYVQFGTFLLDDRNGSRVKIMAHKYLNNPVQINTEILNEWLTGRGKQPVNWATLVEALHKIELSTLAGDISTSKCPSEQWIACLEIHEHMPVFVSLCVVSCVPFIHIPCSQFYQFSVHNHTFLLSFHFAMQMVNNVITITHPFASCMAAV